METMNILWRNIKWRFQNPISILLTIIQPLIWLLLYSSIASGSMHNVSKGNYTAFILPGIMSRKKQVVPPLVEAARQEDSI